MTIGRPRILKPEAQMEVCRELKERRRLMTELRKYRAKIIAARHGVSTDVVLRLDRLLNSPISHNAKLNDREVLT